MIELNEYVRTKDGHIAKYIKKLAKDEDVADAMLFDSYIYEKYKHIRYSFLKEIIVKHSKQLIDLIKVGDYVNGREVKHIAMFEGFPDYPKLIFVDETHLIPDDTCENDEIKTILTKERYMANCYKVGEEDGN